MNETVETTKDRHRPFKPLVIGSPRSGFTLLCSVLDALIPLAQPRKLTRRQRVLNIFIEKLGGHISREIVRVFSDRGIEEDLIFNESFRLMTGGPKWLHHSYEGYACFRKYIGVRGMGDFTLITSHPSEVLNINEIVHSHDDPALWASHPDYADYDKFASVRNPVGIINSSLFSINALASDYIQRFVPPEEDNDELRQRLALFKFTNLDFFEGLVSFYVRYFTEFMECRDQYTIMKWEDLLLDPVPTIQRLAKTARINLPEKEAVDIWRKLDHVNLTGSHRHNFRQGGGKVGDWKNWMTNTHLEIIRDKGLGTHMDALGYGPIQELDEAVFTPFQRKVADYIERGKIFEDYPDPTLFGFAFNKSNLDSEKFSFRRYEWKEWTRVERSNFTDESLQNLVWEAADAATGRLNALFEGILELELDENTGDSRQLAIFGKKHGPLLGDLEKKNFISAIESVEAILASPSHNGTLSVGRWPPFLDRLLPWRRQPDQPGNEDSPPRLIRSCNAHNIVYYLGWYYGVPHALGEIDLARENIRHRRNVISALSYEEVEGAVLNAESHKEPSCGNTPWRSAS